MPACYSKNWTSPGKNAEDEWVPKVEWHRVAICRPRMAEAVLNNIKKGAHVLVEGSLVSSTYEQSNGKSKKAETFTAWAHFRPGCFPAFNGGGQLSGREHSSAVARLSTLSRVSSLPSSNVAAISSKRESVSENRLLSASSANFVATRSEICSVIRQVQ